jgi:tRNA A37 threonylcarbamoyltransferase TsaD
MFAVQFKTCSATGDAMDKPNKAADLTASIRKTVEQLANETDAATVGVIPPVPENLSRVLSILVVQSDAHLETASRRDVCRRVQYVATLWSIRPQR